MSYLVICYFISLENASNSSLLVRLAGVRVIEHETVVKHLLNYQSSIIWIKMWQRRYPRDLVNEPYILCSIYRKKVRFSISISTSIDYISTFTSNYGSRNRKKIKKIVSKKRCDSVLRMHQRQVDTWLGNSAKLKLSARFLLEIQNHQICIKKQYGNI